MNVYFIDGPLTDDQLTEFGRVLPALHSVSIRSPFRQQRLPVVLPVPDSHGSYPLPLRAYVPLLTEHFRRVGIARGLPTALVLPHGNPLTGAVALALKNVLGRPPYLVARRGDDSGPIRVIHPNAIRNAVESFATDPPSPDGP